MWGDCTTNKCKVDPGLDPKPKKKKKSLGKKTDEVQIRYLVYSMLMLISWVWLLYHSGPTLGGTIYTIFATFL